MHKKKGILNGTVPKLCAVCNRASFLKCMECDTIYCSSFCQIKDWQYHQKEHAKKTDKAFSLKEIYSKGGQQSVQQRLIQALHDRPSKLNQNAKDECFKPTYSAKVSRESSPGTESKSVQMRLVQNGSNSSSTFAVAGDDDDPMSQIIDEKIECSSPDEKIECNSPDENYKTFQDKFEEELNYNSTVNSEKGLNSMKSIENALLEISAKELQNKEYKRTVQINPENKDADGFFYVVTMNIDEETDGSVNYYVLPFQEKDNIVIYQKRLNKFYNNDSIKYIAPENYPLNSLVMIKQNDKKWTRCIIHKLLKNEDIIAFENIDDGEKTIKKISECEIKLPTRAEESIPAFCFNIKLCNIGDPSSIEIGDCIKIKIVEIAEDSIIAEVKTETVENSDSHESLEKQNQNNEESEEIKEDRLLINSIKVKAFVTGNKQEFIYLDGSKLNLDKLHVCESLKENTDFYDKLSEDIMAYIKDYSKDNNYKPIYTELILAKYSDGLFYRAMCTEECKNSEESCKVYFIDYGSSCTVMCKDIWKMPKKFLQPIVSRSVIVKLKSGKSLSRIDVDETVGNLCDIEKFMAKVEHINNKYYQITLDDSLVVFKI